MNATNDLDAQYAGSMASTRVVTLDAATITVAANPARLSIMFGPPSTSPLTIFPGTNQAPASGGMLLMPGDRPEKFIVREWGDIVRQTFTLVGTVADTIILTEVLSCVCERK